MAKRKPMNLKLKEGSLRKATGNSPTGNMPEKDKQIKPGDSKALQKKKRLAQNMAKWHHGGKKSK